MSVLATMIVLTYSGYAQRCAYLKSCGFVYDETNPSTPKWVYSYRGKTDSISDEAVMYYPVPKFVGVKP